MKIESAAKHIKSHMHGGKTKVSRHLFLCIEDKLEKAGCQRPYHIKRIMMTSNTNGNYYYGGIYYSK